MANITAAIYADGSLYSGGSAVVDDLKASGFTTCIAWAMHVSAGGDLSFNDTPILDGTGYIGDPAWPDLLASLKQGTTSVDRLIFSVGGWGVGDFPNIQTLIQSQGTGPTSTLYKNFAALKKAIPAIDAIDFDDESLYDPATTVAFSQMLGELGYQVTFCPYSNTDFWVGCLNQLEQSNPGLVTGFNLQCYAGGGGNTPGPWIDAIALGMPAGFPAQTFVSPGLWCRHGDACDQDDCPEAVQQTFAGWKSSGIDGGFIWVLGDIEHCATSGVCGAGAPMGTAAYAAAIVDGLS